MTGRLPPHVRFKAWPVALAVLLALVLAALDAAAALVDADAAVVLPAVGLGDVRRCLDRLPGGLLRVHHALLQRLDLLQDPRRPGPVSLGGGEQLRLLPGSGGLRVLAVRGRGHSGLALGRGPALAEQRSEKYRHALTAVASTGARAGQPDRTAAWLSSRLSHA